MLRKILNLVEKIFNYIIYVITGKDTNMKKEDKKEMYYRVAGIKIFYLLSMLLTFGLSFSTICYVFIINLILNKVVFKDMMSDEVAKA